MVNELTEELAAHVKGMRAQDDGRFDWMQNFHAQLVAMTRGYEDARKDAEAERVRRSEAQASAKASEHQLQSLRQSVDDAAFVLVLIDADADAYMFQDDYYRNTDGGHRAALDLQARVRDYLAMVKPKLARSPMVIKAYANVDGMSKFLVETGTVGSHRSLSSFAKGFSQAFALSDFVLVGHGKDRADKKVRGVFEHFIRNPTCCQIVFGACHDNGYVRMLEDFASDSTTVDRVTLLYSFSVGKEFKKLPFRTTKMETLFRTASPEVWEPPVRAVSHKRPRTDDAHCIVRPVWTNPVDNVRIRSGSTTPEGVQPWTERTIWLNAAGQRVDSRLPQCSGTAPENWTRRRHMIKQKFCRAYHLNGDCRGMCGFSHSPLSDEERLAFRKSLRGQVCHTGLVCRDPNCYYGHNCSCKQKDCKFPREMHNVSTDTAEAWRP